MHVSGGDWHLWLRWAFHACFHSDDHVSTTAEHNTMLLACSATNVLRVATSGHSLAAMSVCAQRLFHSPSTCSRAPLQSRRSSKLSPCLWREAHVMNKMRLAPPCVQPHPHGLDMAQYQMPQVALPSHLISCWWRPQESANQGATTIREYYSPARFPVVDQISLTMGHTTAKLSLSPFIPGGGADKPKPESGRMALVAVLDHSRRLPTVRATASWLW